MGIPTKPKTFVKGSNIMRQSSEKMQNSDNKYNNSVKKEVEVKSLSQKPIEKAKETRQPTSKTTSLTRKLNNINDIITKGVKKSVSKEQLKTDKNLKEKTQNQNSSKISQQKNAENNRSWHNLLMKNSNIKENNKKMLKQKEENLPALTEEPVALDIPKISTNNKLKQPVEKLTKENKAVEEEFEKIFASLKQNATPQERIFLEQERARLKTMYYEIAIMLSDNELPKKRSILTRNESTKSTADLEISKVTSEISSSKEGSLQLKSDKEIISLRYVAPIPRPSVATPKVVSRSKYTTHKDLKSMETLEDFAYKKERHSFQYIKKQDVVELENEVSTESKPENAKPNSSENILKSTTHSLTASSTQSMQKNEINNENNYEELDLDTDEFRSSPENCCSKYFENDELQVEENGSEFDVSKEMVNKTKSGNDGLPPNDKNDNIEKVEIAAIRNEKFDEKRTNFMQKPDETVGNVSQILLATLQNKPFYQETKVCEDYQHNLCKMNIQIFHEIESNEDTKSFAGTKCQNSLQFMQEKNLNTTVSPQMIYHCTTASSISEEIPKALNERVKEETSDSGSLKSNSLPYSLTTNHLSHNVKNTATSKAKNSMGLQATSTVSHSNMTIQLSSSSNRKEDTYAEMREHEDTEISQYSAKNWLENFLKRMSRIYDLSPSAEQSKEKLSLENKNSNPHNEENCIVQNMSDTNFNNDVEVYREESDTQLVIQQLEYNIEQIRHGLTELGRTCDNENEKNQRKRARIVSLPTRRRLSLPKLTDIDGTKKYATRSSANSEDNFFPDDLYDCSSCEFGTQGLSASKTSWDNNNDNDYDDDDDDDDALTSDADMKKHVTWGKVKVETYHIPSPSNTSTIHSDRCTQTEAIQNWTFLQDPTSTNSIDNVDSQDTYTVHDSEHSETKKADSWTDLGEIFYELPNQTHTSAQSRESPLSDDIVLPTYSGCQCMLGTYNSILQQAHDMTPNSDES